MSMINHALKGKNVLVTGATGFIGGRLAERLAVEEGANVVGTGRNLEKAAWLTEKGVRLEEMDLLKTADFPQQLADQQIVFHVAAWLARGGTEQQAHAINVTATEALIHAAKQAGVERFIIVSSIAAYGLPIKPMVDETYPLNVEQVDDYGRTKALGEQQGAALARQLDLDYVVVRPAMVYGPRSDGWTTGMLKLVQRGTPVLFGGGNGHAFPVYIDNLIDGMLKTAVSPNAINQDFHFCDETITFRQFFGYYGKMCGKKPRSMPLWGAKILARANQWFNLKLPITPERIQFLTNQISYVTDKAETLLDYRPRVSLDEGMTRSEAWLKEEGYL